MYATLAIEDTFSLLLSINHIQFSYLQQNQAICLHLEDLYLDLSINIRMSLGLSMIPFILHCQDSQKLLKIALKKDKKVGISFLFIIILN